MTASELDASRQLDQPPSWTLLPNTFPFPLPGSISLAVSFGAVSLEGPQVLFEGPQPDVRRALSDEFQVSLDEPHVLLDEPQALSNEVGT